jgi:hypothetical protein
MLLFASMFVTGLFAGGNQGGGADYAGILVLA